MGYLAVLSGTFLVGLVVTAMVLGFLSQWFYGAVGDGVLWGALLVAMIGAYVVSERYDTISWRPPRARY